MSAAGDVRAALKRTLAIQRAVLLLHVLLVTLPCAYALDPSLDVSQYSHTSWKIRDGFPKGQITTIAQTPDGYLLFGTEFGLMRFDGVKSIPWEWPPGQQLPSNLIFSLLVTRDGTLWIGTLGGLSSWNGEKLTQYPDLAGKSVFGLLQDHDGTVWASGRSVNGGRLCSISNSNIQCDGDDGKFGRGVFSLFEDSKGALWAGVKEGLWRWKPGPPKFYALPGEPDGIQGMNEDSDGRLLIGWNGGIYRFIDGKTEAYPVSVAAGKFSGRKILRDRDGGLWIGTLQLGLVHVHQGRTDVFGPASGLSGPNVYRLFEDREGNIWVSTVDGIDRFRDFAVGTITTEQGLSNRAVLSVLPDRDGSVWLATRDGLSKWINGQITIPRIGSTKADENGLKPTSLFQDHRGRIWVSSQNGFGYLENDRFISVSDAPGAVTSIAEDNSGALWVGNEQVALLKLIQGKVVQQIPWSNFGSKGHATAMAADQLQGGLWLGFQLGGVVYFSDGQVRASYAILDGLAQGRVNQLRIDQDGLLWAATEGGLSQLKNGHIATLTSQNGLPCDTIHWSMDDDDRSLWLYTACGLLRIERAQLDAWTSAVERAKDTKWKIQAKVFDFFDGVRILASGGHYTPQVAKSSDGRIWFLPWDGVSIIDPRHLAFNQLPPPVHVEQIIADRKTYNVIENGSLQLPPHIRDLQIDYTALSLVAPEKILFRYRLDGRDHDWQEVTNRRQAFYNDLPPGTYRFRVIACNNSGVWNETGTFLDFYIEPAYYQTLWFRVAVVAGIALLLLALYELRMRQVAAQVRSRMEERLDERERIARDLHDTLLQSVQGLILKFHAVAKKIPVDVPARDAMEKTLDHADEVLAEGRDRVRNLRALRVPVGGLPAAFESVAEEMSTSSKATFKTVVEGNVLELHPIVREESYCIGREAIINALTHSNGLHVEVEITYDPKQFRLRVRDDGRGIDPKVLDEGGRADHYGMQGMRERAQKIGAQLKVWSRTKTGTEVELLVPGTTAYQAPSTKSRSSWFRRSRSLEGKEV